MVIIIISTLERKDPSVLLSQTPKFASDQLVKLSQPEMSTLFLQPDDLVRQFAVWVSEIVLLGREDGKFGEFGLGEELLGGNVSSDRPGEVLTHRGRIDPG